MSDKKAAWDAVHAAYKGTPIVSAVPKAKTILKLPTRKPRPAPIGAPLAPMSFKGGAQKEEIPEREQEGVKEVKAKAEKPKGATANEYLTTFWDLKSNPKKPVDGWLMTGKKIIRKAIKNVVADITNGDIKPSSFYINVPLGKLIPKNFIVGKGSWNQGAEVSISFDSPDVSFADEESLVGARIGIRWTEKGAPTDKPGESWWGCIRLAVSVSKDGKETWETHARTEHERADDERVDKYVEKRLKALDKTEGYSGNALEALKEANQEVERVMEEKHKE